MSKIKTAALAMGRIAKTIWEVPAVKSVALTWLIRVGVPAGSAAIIIPIVDALTK